MFNLKPAISSEYPQRTIENNIPLLFFFAPWSQNNEARCQGKLKLVDVVNRACVMQWQKADTESKLDIWIPCKTLSYLIFPILNEGFTTWAN